MYFFFLDELRKFTISDFPKCVILRSGTTVFGTCFLKRYLMYLDALYLLFIFHQKNNDHINRFLKVTCKCNELALGSLERLIRTKKVSTKVNMIFDVNKILLRRSK